MWYIDAIKIRFGIAIYIHQIIGSIVFTRADMFGNCYRKKRIITTFQLCENVQDMGIGLETMKETS